MRNENAPPSAGRHLRSVNAGPALVRTRTEILSRSGPAGSAEVLLIQGDRLVQRLQQRLTHFQLGVLVRHHVDLF